MPCINNNVHRPIVVTKPPSIIETQEPNLEGGFFIIFMCLLALFLIMGVGITL